MDCYYELEVEKIFENHEIRFRGPCSLWRMNLLAVSDRDKTTMFIAVEDTIYVYQLNILDGKPGEPSKILKRPVDSEPSQKINAIKVGMIGNEEVLVSVDESGCVRIWFTANLDKNPIQFSNDESTWGIALHGPKRLLAVSANSREITIFNLQKSVQFFSEFDDDDDDDLDSSDEEEPQTPKTYASVLTKISDNDALGGKAVSVLQGHENNIPNICFSACGRFLVSCSIDSTCRIWNVKTGELIQTKLLTVDAGDFQDLNDSEDWGWTANFVSRSAFKIITNNCEIGRRLVSNSAVAPSSPRSVGTMNSLYQQLRYNFDIQGPNLQGEDLYRIIISRDPRFRNREYEDGYIEDGAYFENDYSTEGESNDDDVELDDDDDDDDDDDTEVESDSSVNSLDEDFEISFHPSQQSSDRERPVMEIEGNATPAYYDRAESATPVVENYTENDPDYRWSVGHELSILSNNDGQNDAPLISSREIEDHNEERPEEIMEEILNQPTQNSTYVAHDSSVQSSHSPRSTVSLSQIISENITPVPSHSNPNLSVSPTFNPVSPTYNPASPTYNPVSPEYVPANRESSPSHLPIAQSIINNGLQQESLLPDQNGRNDSLSDEQEVELISQPSSTNIVDISMEEEYSNTTTHDDETIHSPTSPLSLSFRGGTIIDSPSRDRPDLGLADELVLYTSKHNLFILDPKSNLKILHTERDVVRKVDLRRFLNYDCDRLNMVELIPELSLVIVASQRGKIVLTRLIRIEDDDGNENYYLYPENYLPQQVMPSPLLGMFVVKHNVFQDPALFYYRLYLMYYSGSMFCYEIRREKRTNPLRMDNVLI